MNNIYIYPSNVRVLSIWSLTSIKSKWTLKNSTRNSSIIELFQIKWADSQCEWHLAFWATLALRVIYGFVIELQPLMRKVISKAVSFTPVRRYIRATLMCLFWSHKLQHTDLVTIQSNMLSKASVYVFILMITSKTESIYFPVLGKCGFDIKYFSWYTKPNINSSCI